MKERMPRNAERIKNAIILRPSNICLSISNEPRN